ncbi:MAG TPA: DnaA/Hda family protein [Desulfitobacteriaceae bacterium]|nr:DnaA/Hda family protein [Desulfitobacteriaceae bacterium]
MRLFVSDFNSLAYKTFHNYKLVDAPAVTLIYGLAGLGKTTLLDYLYQSKQIKRIPAEYINARTFAQTYAYAAQNNLLFPFRERFRTPKILFMDDLHLLAGKSKTLGELFYTYEYIIEREGKLIISLEADFPALGFLGEGLASRFLGGLVLKIKQPSSPEIERFIEYYLAEKNLNMKREVIKAISDLVCNPGMAVSSINEFVKFSESKGKALTLKCFQEYLRKAQESNLRKLEPLNVIRVTAEVTGTTASELLGFKRTPKIAEARQLAIYAVRLLCHNSYPEIGRSFSRGHGAIIYACRKMEKRMEQDGALKQKLAAIKKFFII